MAPKGTTEHLTALSQGVPLAPHGPHNEVRGSILPSLGKYLGTLYTLVSSLSEALPDSSVWQ